MQDIAQPFTLPGNPPVIVGLGDPFFDVLQANSGSSPVTTGGTITFQYPSARAPASYRLALGLGAAGSPAMFIRAMQAQFVAETDFTVSFGPTSIVVTYLAQTTIPAGSTVSLQLPVNDTSGYGTLAGHALPPQALEPNPGL